jgi:hypothetical protein
VWGGCYGEAEVLFALALREGEGGLAEEDDLLEDGLHVFVLAYSL